MPLRLITILLPVVSLVAAGLPAAVAADAGSPGFEHNPYLTYSCKDLILAASDASKKADQAVGVKGDQIERTGGEVAIFWPKAFFANLTGQKASQLSHLKHEMLSIEEASIEGQCPIQFDGPRPPGA